MELTIAKPSHAHIPLSEKNPPSPTAGSTAYLFPTTTPQPQPQPLTPLLFSRARFLLRLLSALFSLTALVLLMRAHRSYTSTSSRALLFGGTYLWPTHPSASVTLAPTTILLATSATTSCVSVLLLLLGSWRPSIRHVTRLGDSVALAAGVANLALAVGGAATAHVYKSERITLESWTCRRSLVDHPLVRFAVVCTEIAYARTMGWGVVGAEAVGIVVVLAGWVVVGRGWRGGWWGCGV